MELTNIKTNIKKQYFNNLLKTTNKLNIENEWIKEKIKSLKITDFTESDKIESSEKKEYSEEYLYRKTWNKLSYAHKIIKLKEFVLKLPIKYEQDKENLIKKLNILVKEKKITKKDKVLYDKINGRVISIPNLEYKDGKYYINL